MKRVKAALQKARARYAKWRRERKRAKPGGDRRKRLAGLVRFWRERKERLAKRLEQLRHRLGGAPGPPAWGGCRQVTDKVIAIVGTAAPVTSRKRSYVPSGGSSTSEHLTWMLRSDAVDFGIADAFTLAQRIRSELAGGTHHDYEFFYFTFDGRRFRGQVIASSHGTGPHLHFGCTRVD